MKKDIKIGITTGLKSGVSTELIETIMGDKSLQAMFNLRVLECDDDPSGVKSLELATSAIANKEIDAVVTTPISKAEAAKAGFNHPGQTEYFSNLYRVQGREPFMLLMSDNLRVALVTKHTALKDVASQITTQRVVDTIRSLSRTLVVDFRVSSPKIAVLSLNPHCGEGGMFGNEEQSYITPAIEIAQNEGIYAFGPFAADGFFGSESYTKFDAIVAMYHDQGLAPFKALAFDSGVNYTAGLPVVRTSPAHGVGLDIAGKGIASANSLRSAIYAAADIVRSRRYYAEISANPLKKQQRNDQYENRRGGHKDVNVDELFSDSGELK